MQVETQVADAEIVRRLSGVGPLLTLRFKPVSHPAVQKLHAHCLKDSFDKLMQEPAGIYHFRLYLRERGKEARLFFIEEVCVRWQPILNICTRIVLCNQCIYEP